MTPHILIVDADESAAQVTAAIVKRVAPEATISIQHTPEHGWLSLLRTPPDVLILDPGPHGPLGTLLIRLCKQERPQTQVMVLASRPTPGLRKKVQQMGVAGYLEKPAPFIQLADQLRAILDGQAEQPAAANHAGAAMQL